MESVVIVDGDAPGLSPAPVESPAPAESSTAPVAAAEPRAPKPDAVVLGAVTLARDAALEEAAEPGTPGSARVGEHLGAVMEAERVALHRFACTDEAYVGWVWTVELSRVPRSKVATIDDVVLLPGEGALLAPAWVPYDERIRPGDLGVGDVISTPDDDPRLVLSGADYPADESTDIDDALWWELGLGRPRVLSAWGRDDAAERWWEGDAGPEAPIARAATAACADCGFYVRLAGGLGRMFGVCSNALAPDDGRVVAIEHGCGAHSETVVETVTRWADTPPADELEAVDTAAEPVDTAAEPVDVAVEPEAAAESSDTAIQPEAAVDGADVDLAALVEPELATAEPAGEPDQS